MSSRNARTAVVTGGNSGIGRAVAGALAGTGTRLVIAGRREEANRRTADDLRERHGVEVEPVTADVSREADCIALISRAAERFGAIDLLINNAGIGTWDTIAETATEDFDRVLKTNLYGAFWCAREAFRRMRENPEVAGLRGSIVNIASVAGKEAWSGPGTCCRVTGASTPTGSWV